MRGGGQPNSGNDTDNITDTSTTTTVGEIWNGTAFKKTNFNKLLSYLSSAGTVDALSSGTIKASDIYTSTYGGKSANTSVIVNFGGIEWIVVYVSQDKSGNPIATLWQASSFTRSSWSSGWYDNGEGNAWPYPCGMYGTSYIRSISLNIGSSYAGTIDGSTGQITDSSKIELKPSSQSSSHTYAKFTMPTVSGSVTNYLVTPSKVSWQERQSMIEIYPWGWLQPNDAYGDMGTATGQGVGWYSESSNFYSGSGSQVNRSDYTAWKNDYIWLPSETETGWAEMHTGLWGTNINERSNSTSSWTRSINCSGLRVSQGLYLDGSGGKALDVHDVHAVRPALHLNLRAASNNLTIDISSATVSVADQTYTGSALTPNPTITYNGTTLTKGTDYTLSYSNNTNVGTATITITGIGDYEGTTTKNFKITKRSLTKPTLKKSSFTYTGSTITVIKNTSSSQDYIINFNYSYETASGTMSATDVGTYTFTIKLDNTSNTQWSGGSTSTLSYTWSITKADISSATMTLSPTSYTYDKTEK